MKKYKIGASYGFAGCEIQDIIEAESKEDAWIEAETMALERVEWWVEEIKEDD